MWKTHQSHWLSEIFPPLIDFYVPTSNLHRCFSGKHPTHPFISWISMDFPYLLSWFSHGFSHSKHHLFRGISPLHLAGLCLPSAPWASFGRSQRHQHLSMGVSGGWLEKNNQTYLSTDFCVFFLNQVTIFDDKYDWLYMFFNLYLILIDYLC